MANKLITFKEDPDKALRLFPDERYDISLSTWGTNARVATQAASPNQGKYSATVDDTYRYWTVFEGATQPANWSSWLQVIDIEEETISNALLTMINEVQQARRTVDQNEYVLYNNENTNLVIPVGSLTGQLRLVIESKQGPKLVDSLLTISGSAITLSSTAPITTRVRTLDWSLRVPTTNEVKFKGTIKVDYTPITATP